MKFISGYLLMLSVFFFASCSPYQRLVKDFNDNKTSVEYLHTSKLASAKKDIYVTIAEPVITEPRFKGGQIKRVKTEVIPLLFYNGWNYTYDCAVGKNQIQENMNTFIQTALLKESIRSGIYHADVTSNHAYTLEVEVDSLHATGAQKTSGFFAYLVYFYLYSNSVKVKSEPAYCRFHYRLRKGDEVIREDYVGNFAQLDLLKPYPFSTKTINRYFKAHLVELVSEVIKKNIEQVVRDVNKELRDEPDGEVAGGR